MAARVYKNTVVVYKGITFRSKLELWIYKQLQGMKKNKGFVVEYETEKIPYVIQRNYIPDFIITLSNGHKIYVEAKGYFAPADRAKLKAVKKANPDMDLRIVFSKDNKLSKKSKTTYSQWAEKNNIPWAINNPKAEWFKT